MRRLKLIAAMLGLMASMLPVQLLASDNLAVRAPAAFPTAHVAVVVMENRPQSAIIGHPNAPYLNSLAREYTYLDNYSAVAYPSLPNYLALTGGDTFGITSNCSNCYIAGRNISDLLAEAGMSGKAYMEDMPRPCFCGRTRTYAQKHNPYSELAIDLAAGQLPSFIWITPNMCHDMHDCGVAAGDRWLAENIPPLLSSPAFSQRPSLLAIVWDEDDGSAANRVPLILAGPRVKRGFVSHAPANHYSLLRTIEAIWGLPSLTANDAAALPLTDVFQD